MDRHMERLGLIVSVNIDNKNDSVWIIDHHERERERDLASVPVSHTCCLKLFSNCVPLLRSANMLNPLLMFNYPNTASEQYSELSIRNGSSHCLLCHISPYVGDNATSANKIKCKSNVQYKWWCRWNPNTKWFLKGQQWLKQLKKTVPINYPTV